MKRCAQRLRPVVLFWVAVFGGGFEVRAEPPGHCAPPTDGDGVHTELQSAAWLGERDRVWELLEAGAEPDEADDEHGETPLMFAAAWGHLEIMEMLLAFGADPNARSFREAPPLSYAILHEEHDAASLLLAAGADVNDSWFKIGMTPLLYASHFGDVAMMSLLLDAGANPTIRSDSGVCALISAAAAGHTSAVQMLLDLGFDIESTDHDGTSALMFAVMRRHPEVVKVLLEAGAEVDAAQVDGDTPLLRAGGVGCVECAELLLNAGAAPDVEGGDGANAIMRAAWYGHADVLDALIDGGVNLHAVGPNGETALAYAATQGHPEVIAKLLEFRAEIDRVNSSGETALMLAAKANCEACVVELLRAGADFTLRSESGKSTLDLAIANGSDSTARAMVDAGVIEGAPQEELDQLLRQSVRQKLSRETVALLIDSGADPNGTDRRKRTPLHLAAHEGNVDALELLLEAGADVYAVDSDGAIPLFATGAAGSSDERDCCFRILISAGPDFARRAGEKGSVQKTRWVRRASKRLSSEAVDELAEVLDFREEMDRLHEMNSTELFHFIQTMAYFGRFDDLVTIRQNPDFKHIEPWIASAIVKGADRAAAQGFTAQDLVAKLDLQTNDFVWPQGRTPLHDYDVSELGIEFAVSLGLDPNAEDISGRRPLCYALSSRGELVAGRVQKLLTLGADPNLPTQRTLPIDRAINSGLIEATRVLVEAGADVNAAPLDRLRRSKTISNRFEAALGHEGILQLLVDAGLDLNFEGEITPPMHLMVQRACLAAWSRRNPDPNRARRVSKTDLNARLDDIRRLHALGADIEVWDGAGRTPLMKATEIAVFSVLLELGADIEAVDSRRRGILEVLMDTPRTDPRVIAIFCENKDLWDSAVETGRNPLAAAVSIGNIDVFEQVLAVAPEIDATDAQGQTALFIALSETSNALRLYQQRPNTESDENRLATAHRIVEGLLQAGASVHVTDKIGQTPLHLAVDIRTVRLLVDHGADVNARDKAMRTPLIAAAMRQDPVALRALLDFGADPLLTDAGGRMAIDYLREPSNSAMHAENHDLKEAYRRVYWRLKDLSLR